MTEERGRGRRIGEGGEWTEDRKGDESREIGSAGGVYMDWWMVACIGRGYKGSLRLREGGRRGGRVKR